MTRIACLGTEFQIYSDFAHSDIVLQDESCTAGNTGRLDSEKAEFLRHNARNASSTP